VNQPSAAANPSGWVSTSRAPSSPIRTGTFGAAAAHSRPSGAPSTPTARKTTAKTAAARPGRRGGLGGAGHGTSFQYPGPAGPGHADASPGRGSSLGSVTG
jgi:hypothetical protein